MTASFIVMGQAVAPLIERGFANWVWAKVLSWTFAMLFSAPFLWAMLTSFRGFGFAGAGLTEPGIAADKKMVLPPYAGVGTLFFSRFFSLLWLGFLSLEFFSARYSLLIMAILLGIFMAVFRRQLGDSYRWFEGRFLSTFENTPKSKRPTDVFRHLAPWDAHLVRFKVHPNSEVAGACLSDMGLRDRFGLNVVVIQRGLKTMVAPAPSERIYPKDELLVLGTDEQAEGARRLIEKPPGLAERFRDLSGYELRRFLVTDESSFANRAIKESGIRERFGGMVVGIERAGSRIINPASNVVLKPADVLWIVGDTDRLETLT
jgi:CPA2 family monovalent cation:H+ antiporter-2